MGKVQAPTKLFDDWSDWEYDDNLRHWVSSNDKYKAIVWQENLTPPKPEGKKLSKSSSDDKIVWDGICIGIHGGPEPSPKVGDILYWIRTEIKKDSNA